MRAKKWRDNLIIKLNRCPVSFVDVPESTYIDGILGVYELNQTALLKEVFMWACERSVARYGAIRASLGAPDPFRMQYHRQIAELIRQIVLSKRTKSEAIQEIQKYSAEHIPEMQRQKFIEVVEVELQSLHQGNIGRYLIGLREFNEWALHAS